jgi:hypothetical protein
MAVDDNQVPSCLIPSQLNKEIPVALGHGHANHPMEVMERGHGIQTIRWKWRRWFLDDALTLIHVADDALTLIHVLAR